MSPDFNRARARYHRVSAGARDEAATDSRSGLASAMIGVLWVNAGVSLPLAILAALATGALIGFSIQPFVSAVILQLIFSVQWVKWFGSSLLPTSGMYPPGHTGFDLVLMLKHMILPVIVVSIQTIAAYSRYMRASLLDVMNGEP